MPAADRGSRAALPLQIQLDLVGLLAPGSRWLYRPAIGRSGLAVAGALHGRRCGWVLPTVAPLLHGLGIRLR
ncbi:MAG: hypothetical protein OXT64_14600, partial [Gammaproteobacteria bacterium]|nr:hypothetical protein [Gammaproteobacteria bacterium]